MTFKKLFTHLFVVLVNFYLLTFLTGLLLMAWTVFATPIHPLVVQITVFVTLLICIVYQATRTQWSLTTIGEILISNTGKEDILVQVNPFSITRIPIFVLIQVTLILNGNLQDGLSERQRFGLGTVLGLGLVFFCVYDGLKNFFIKPTMLPVFMLASGLLLVGYRFKTGTPTNDLLFKIYLALAILWVCIGFLYTKKQKSEPLSTQN